MGGREVLGAADVSDGQFRQIVAAALAEDPAAVRVDRCEITRVAYDLASILTIDRHWVTGTARTPGGQRTYRVFVKTIGSFEHSSFFAQVPEPLRRMAATMQWRTEADAYRSQLREVLPAGLSMPRAFAVREIDETRIALWLEAIPAVPHVWSIPDLADAAYRLGRLAASPAVADAASTIRDRLRIRMYAAGRLAHLVLPALRSEELARHPLIRDAFGPIRDRLLAAADAVPTWLDELEATAEAISHGDASPNNLLRTAGTSDLTLIDFAFFGPQPVGFDLAQLLLGEVQIGRRPTSELPDAEAAVLPAYVAGLASEGMVLDARVVERAHAVAMMIFSGLSGYPFEHLDKKPTPDLLALAHERAAASRICLDVLEGTVPA